jgi:hypothetical protein
VREELEQAIVGRGAFRRFEETIHRRGVEEEWYQFREKVFRKMAITWLEANGIPYT